MECIEKLLFYIQVCNYSCNSIVSIIQISYRKLRRSKHVTVLYIILHVRFPIRECKGNPSNTKVHVFIKILLVSTSVWLSWDEVASAADVCDDSDKINRY